ncbi:MAG: ORF6N domain-containing protein [Salinivirgaceae bacterium]|nr:ORF6N domain-containing protein [Salinivirgaceae bacterium]
MTNEIAIIQNKILVIRNQQVMIDRDIAELYGVETKRLNEQVKRNIERFPDEFCFQLNDNEFKNWKSQFATSNSDKMGLRKKPYAFTEHGVTMLATVLKSETAVKASIQIVKAFVAMRKFLLTNAQIFQRLDSLEMHRIESDKRIDELFDRMDRYAIDNTQGIFFQGQIFDAYAKFESFIAQAQHSIVLIDNYIDLSVLERFTKKNAGVQVTIYTHPQTPITAQDVQRFNAQYPLLEVKHTTTMHDRFLIIDNQTLYHIGASLKDLGKRCFAFDVFDSSFIADIMARL